jgi:membrane protein implicated in regulation of membrane protease activity
MDSWMIWVLLAVIFAAGEVASLSFFLAPFAVGALLAAVADLAGLSAVATVVIFLLSSGLLLGFVRPIARRHMYTAPSIRTGTAALVGKSGVVTERVDDRKGTIKLEGEMWTAKAYNEGEVIEVGRKVDVIEIRGATALVSDTE